MLSPLSLAFAASDPGGSAAIIFISGSGITTTGSSPGCQRSMPSSAPPSEDVPKNRFAVLMFRPSRAADRSMVVASGAVLSSSSGWASSESEMSYCGSGGALIAACNSGSSGERAEEDTATAGAGTTASAADALAPGAAGAGAVAVLAPGTE